MDEEKLYKKAKKVVDKKVKFYRHVFAYIFVNIILFILNFSEIRGNWSNMDQWWFLWVTVLWGVWLAFHYIKVFILQDRFDDDWMEEKIQKEMDKMRK
ncbi:2TM domain-containing protein [uncultured Methanobrevibacter sp.]|uniref:2TM domain-containing protein n=1 Tax=uncultured Methanobrevibacter sp. TaxID=253161 RepID=UPI0026351CAA|nr:2TM domain-containing protein [uncultured Methanobrevibacter sp.]